MTVTEHAEILALNALAFLANSPEEISRFVSVFGIDPATISKRAGDSHFLSGVLDFLLTDDSLLMRFCETEGCKPQDIHNARQQLSR